MGCFLSGMSPLVHKQKPSGIISVILLCALSHEIFL